MPPAVAAATRVSLRLLQEEHWRRQHLQELIARFRVGAQQLGLQLLDSFSPIQPIIIGDEARALLIAERLAERGFLIIAIRPPTVPPGTARLRISISASHTKEEIEKLAALLAQL